MANGDLFPASKIHEFHSLLQRSQPQQPFDLNNYCNFRHQEWPFNQPAAARASSVKDHGLAKCLIHDMVFRKDGKPSTSHLLDVRDPITINGDGMPPHQFLEERRWLPSGMVGNQGMDGRTKNFYWIDSSSRPLASSNYNYYNDDDDNSNNKIHSNSHDPIVINDGLEPQFESPFRLELQKQPMTQPVCEFGDNFGKREVRVTDMKKMRMMREGSMPNLQLSLSPRSVDDGANAKKALEAEETESALSLSLLPSPLMSTKQVHPFKLPKETIQFLQRNSSNKAALETSTLDLTMSIKALE